MKKRLMGLWESIRGGFWFLPSVMAVAAIALSFAMVALDHRVEREWLNTVGWVWAGGVDGARSVLSTIAGSVMTVAGVVFSITITALTLASSQFGPRLLRTFMRDVGNQITLGTFIATFLYCLMVLRTVRSVQESRFVPDIAVTVGIVLAVLSIGVLIYFIHHAATSIQADVLCAAIARDIDEVTERLFPQHIGDAAAPCDVEIPADFDRKAQPVCATQSGYVQGIDSEGLLRMAQQHDIVVRVVLRPGAFVARGGTLAEIYPSPQVTEGIAKGVGDVFTVGSQRTPEQDAEFAVDQLVEIAVRALSPGINDPRTAMVCISWLGSSLSRLVAREFPGALRRDKQGKLRVIAEPVTFEEIVQGALNPLRHYGASDMQVVTHLLRTIEIIAAQTQSETNRTLLRHHANLIAQDGQRESANPDDQRVIAEHLQSVLRALTPIQSDG